MRAAFCPRCGKRPRRRPGSPCTPCSVEENRERRRSAAPKREVFDQKLTSKRFIITSAQNATPAHAGFLAALKVAAKHKRAQLVVVPLRYRNPTSLWSSKQENDEWWAPELVPYLCNQRKRLGPNLVLVADVKVQPTARSPLSGFESLTGGESCILAHPKMQFRSVPAPSGSFPKILSTTGSVTERNFTDTKAGALGDFHHFLGAVVVELDGREFHLRQLNADRETGEFTDLEHHYTARGVRRAPRAAGLSLGDTHALFACPVVDRATFGPGGIVEVLDPEVVLFSDLLDGFSVNPHHEGNPFIAAAKGALANVREEVEHAVRFVLERTRGRRAVIIPSNHDNFLARWIVSTDWRRAPLNAAFYLETAKVMLDSARVGPGGVEYADPFTYWVRKLAGDAVTCLEPDESYLVAGVECGMHGDRGPNGARGSIRNLSRLGARVTIGHSHTPGIEDGAYQCGTSTPLRLEYNRGPSSWLNTHCVTYATGKRALVTIINGRWRA